jgi:hypothetical protein
MFAENEGALIWRHGRQILELSAWDRNSIRVRATLNSGFADVPGALLAETAHEAEVRITDS